MKKILIVVVLLAAVAGGVFWFMEKTNSSAPRIHYRTDAVVRGNLVDYISATGTVEPEKLVDVGAQVGGMIASFGKDINGKEIDYGSEVKANSVLAVIDAALYVADLRQAEAQLAQAKANLISSEASLKQLRAKLLLAENNYNRASRLRPTGALSQSDYDAALSELDVAKANISVGEAALEQGRAAISNAEASRDRAQRNLDYCTIKSPVDGVIIDRQVNIGQTVISSMSAPSLFLIAKDLRKMQIWVSVNEADIGRIRAGQRVTFTVDAFPGEVFVGEVGKVRLNASMSQNVVTYVVEVLTDNSNGKLLPYLTASVRFIIQERKNILSVPNAALRVKLDGAASADPAVWVLEDGTPRRVAVKRGLNDGIRTEVEGEGLTENMTVVIGTSSVAVASGAKATTAGSPFLPKPPRRH